jgi:hypothetical protein
MSSGPYVYEKLAQLQDQDRNVSQAQGLSIVYWLHRISVPKSASQITLSDPFPLHLSIMPMAIQLLTLLFTAPFRTDIRCSQCRAVMLRGLARRRNRGGRIRYRRAKPAGIWAQASKRKREDLEVSSAIYAWGLLGRGLKAI